MFGISYDLVLLSTGFWAFSVWGGAHMLFDVFSKTSLTHPHTDTRVHNKWLRNLGMWSLMGYGD